MKSDRLAKFANSCPFLYQYIVLWAMLALSQARDSLREPIPVNIMSCETDIKSNRDI